MTYKTLQYIALVNMFLVLVAFIACAVGGSWILAAINVGLFAINVALFRYNAKQQE